MCAAEVQSFYYSLYEGRRLSPAGYNVNAYWPSLPRPRSQPQLHPAPLLLEQDVRLHSPGATGVSLSGHALPARRQWACEDLARWQQAACTDSGRRAQGPRVAPPRHRGHDRELVQLRDAAREQATSVICRDIDSRLTHLGAGPLRLPSSGHEPRHLGAQRGCARACGERQHARHRVGARAGAGRYGRAAAARRHLRPQRRRAPRSRRLGGGRQSSKSTSEEGCALSAQPWPTPCRSPLLLLLLLHG